MTKDSVSNIITAFYKDKPDTIIIGLYHLYDNLWQINYKYEDDDTYWSTTLRETDSEVEK